MRKKLSIVIIVILLLTMTGVKGLSEEDTPLQNFQEVLYLIRTFYVEEVEMKQLIDGAINGMVEELDTYSNHMSPKEYDDMQTNFEGHFGGIGIVITIRNDKLTIVSPIKDTPGDRAGLKAGDVIKAVDGELTSEMSQQKAVDKMRGEPGTEVELTIEREGGEEPLIINIVRDDIEPPNVVPEMKENNIGHIAIAQFLEDTGVKVEDAIKELKEEGAEAIILDLRNNPGGLLEEAVKVASIFVDEGTIVTIKQREEEDKVFKREESVQLLDLPLAVLINEGSASASEIVAGAVKDCDRGVLIGTKTFGKGTVQSVVPLSDGSALRLTTARYYTPSGNFIHDQGIEPDLEIEYDPEAEEDLQLERAIEYLNSLEDKAA
ncbi:MAG: S41 family peptidase [Halanaerobiaceae bacterium]